MFQTDNYKYLSYIIKMLKDVKHNNAFNYLNKMIKSLNSNVRNQIEELSFNNIISNETKKMINRTFIEYLKNQRN